MFRKSGIRFPDKDVGKQRFSDLVPRRGLEPPRLAALVPETSASTNSATWACAAIGTEPSSHCQSNVLDRDPIQFDRISFRIFR